MSITFFVCGPKYANFSPNVGGVVDDEELLRFLICWYFPEIFAIKAKVVKNCEKFWTIFCRHNFLGVGIVKIVPILSPLPHGTSSEKKSREDTLLAGKLLSLTS